MNIAATSGAVGGPLCLPLRPFSAGWQKASRVDRVLEETDWELSPAAPVGVSERGWKPRGGWSSKCPWGRAQAG